MIAVIFEVCLHSSTKEDYFTLAGKLKAHLEKVNGFISVERFQSLQDPDKYLSLSFWQDEQAVKAWRNTLAHRQAQKTGRSGIFSSYRIRVASVLRDYDMDNGAQSPEDSHLIHHS
ncbi:antibiotic biosynthesis monooxygenase [Thalassomonas sp. RHCl1]|uniref:antibiotic biosynthesis monooxygenase family protein n=1 Tax=Thalassomonas sp. RHCl1 TaxID=2995320 RepID=UPI00248C1FB8|nr:antibiotic biosynthesis monooxygenase [Thalassomonas sp. RHCl1]